MKIIEIKDLEDCFDGSFIKEVLFDTGVSKELIFHLAKKGDIQYYPSFARPFYKIEVKGRYTLKGVEGNQTMRLLLFRVTEKENQIEFVDNINKFSETS